MIATTYDGVFAKCIFCCLPIPTEGEVIIGFLITIGEQSNN